MEPGSKITSSRHTTETEQGTHRFEIVGYSHNKGIGAGNFIRSGTFTVGGYKWAIRFYPDGEIKGMQKYVSFSVEPMSKAMVRVSMDFRLVNQLTASAQSIWSPSAPRVFNSCHGNRFAMRGAAIRRDELELEASGFIRGDCLTIECALTVIKQPQVSDTTRQSEIKVPPSDLSDHFRKLLLEEEAADVTFSVGGETFAAHKIVLATRSPVFKAELYGQMKETTARRITIEQMQPDVFRALLHFVYTDSLPDMDGLDHDDYIDMIRHLLVAADRYAMLRLKMVCESTLADNLDVQTAASTLALAEQHNCACLKDVCIGFITSSDEMDAVMATQGYQNLKKTCPSILVDVLERTSRHRQTHR